MELPKSFNDLTVSQFIEASKILKEETDLLERNIKLIALLSNKGVDWVESKTPAELGQLAKNLDFLLNPEVSKRVKRWIVINKRIYKPILDVNNLNWGQVKSLKTLAEKEEYPNQYLNQKLAIVYSKVTWYGIGVYKASDHSVKAEDLLKAKLGDVYGTLFFYTNVLERLNPVMETYLKEANQTIAEIMPEVMDWAKKNPQILKQAGLTIS